MHDEETVREDSKYEKYYVLNRLEEPIECDTYKEALFRAREDCIGTRSDALILKVFKRVKFVPRSQVTDPVYEEEG